VANTHRNESSGKVLSSLISLNAINLLTDVDFRETPPVGQFVDPHSKKDERV
jgi:hypothetical protein